jgi:glycerol-3-phosphate cytidylyltransferase
VDYLGEMINIDELVKTKTRLHSEGKKVVFTNGVFDLMHAGHVRLLKKAKYHGDVLVVGMNSDSSVKKIKGQNRPIISENYRAEVLCSLSSVDYVVIFDESTPVETIGKLEPDIHVKGGDWKIIDLPETKLIESYGGKVIIEKSDCEITTTKVIEKIASEFPRG